ncbi:MAG: hypothetical protein V1799_12850 [bacterium]
MRRLITLAHAFPLSLVLLLALSSLAGLVSSCDNEDENTLRFTGTVTYIDLEGGFYGITGDDRKHYDPINLAQEFKKDGLRVRIEARERNDMGSIHMWGTLIEIHTIERI